MEGTDEAGGCMPAGPRLAEGAETERDLLGAVVSFGSPEAGDGAIREPAATGDGNSVQPYSMAAGIESGRRRSSSRAAAAVRGYRAQGKKCGRRATSCLACVRAHRRCDGWRPCGRCLRLGRKTALCCTVAPTTDVVFRRRESVVGYLTDEADRGGKLPICRVAKYSPLDGSSDQNAVFVHDFGKDEDSPGCGVLRLYKHVFDQAEVRPRGLHWLPQQLQAVDAATYRCLVDVMQRMPFDAPAESLHVDACTTHFDAVVEGVLADSPVPFSRVSFDADGRPSRMFINNSCSSLLGYNPYHLAQVYRLGSPVIFIHSDDVQERATRALTAHAIRQRCWVNSATRHCHLHMLEKDIKVRYYFFRGVELVSYEYWPNGKVKTVTTAFVGCRPDVDGFGPSAVHENICCISSHENIVHGFFGGAIDFKACGLVGEREPSFFLDHPATAAHMARNHDSYVRARTLFAHNLIRNMEAGNDPVPLDPATLKGVTTLAGVDPGSKHPRIATQTCDGDREGRGEEELERELDEFLLGILLDDAGGRVSGEGSAGSAGMLLHDYVGDELVGKERFGFVDDEGGLSVLVPGRHDVHGGARSGIAAGASHAPAE